MPAGTGALQAALPDYDITHELGRGAMGIVYLGTHRALGRTVAIKELPPSFATDSGVRDRFLAEARTVASLDHPHVVVIHDFVDRDGHLAIVMEHLPNGTVWDQFVNHGLAAPRACGLTLSTLAGLHHAHERGVMHRDIKPENLIFTHDWQLKVTDFGIAQVLTGDSTMSTEEGAIVGTPAYMSPEQAEGRTCGPPADVYASGAMLYEMLSGTLPFPDGETAMDMALARLSSDPVPLAQVAPTVPAPIAEATMTALRRSEADRFANAEEFGVALAQAAATAWGPDWMSESGTAVRGSTAIEAAARTTDRRRSLPSDVQAADPAAAATDAQGDVGQPAVPAQVPAPAPTQYEQPSPAAVSPRQRDRVGGADLNQLAPSDIIDLRQVRGPGTPIPFLIAGVALLALAALAAFSGRGNDPEPIGAAQVTIAGTPVDGNVIDVDLTSPVAFSGPVGAVDASLLGIPIGGATISGGELDPGYLRFTAAGVIEFEGETAAGDAVRFPVRATNSPYPTAPFVVAVLVGIGGLASIQSNLKAFRARRFRIAPYIGLAISGALAGAAAAVVAMLVRSTPMAQSGVITCAVLGAVGSVLLGEGYRRRYRRRRLRRIAVARGRR